MEPDADAALLVGYAPGFTDAHSHAESLDEFYKCSCFGYQLRTSDMSFLSKAHWWVRTLVLVAVLVCSGAAAEPNQKPRTPRVAGIVLKWIRMEKEMNYRRIEPLIREAAAHGAEVVCTTECFLDGYAIADKSIPLEDYRAIGESIPHGKYFDRLAALADELNIHLIAGMTEADGEARYNVSVLIGPDGRLIGKYRKQKLQHELERNVPGSESLVFNSGVGRFGMMICADRTEPAIVQRFCAQGAEFLICPSGGMFGPKNNDPILQARSRENKIHIVFVHPAQFLVTGPDGSILSNTLVGNRLVVPKDEIGGSHDRNQVFYFDLPVGGP